MVTADKLRSSATINLSRLVAFRNLVLAAQIIALTFLVYGIGLSLPIPALAVIIIAYGILNGLTWLRLRRAAPATDMELFVQLLADVVVLTVLLYLTGGSTNPFVSLFLLPLTLAAAALPGAYTWAMAAVTAVCYSLLMVFYIPLPHRHGNDFNLHVLGMWSGFMLSAGLIAFFAVRMNTTLRRRDQALAQAREQALRDERLVALGTLAAGAAHEMGTPLATMAIVTKELANDYADTPELTARLTLVRRQIDRCKAILSSMADAAGQARADAGRARPLDLYLGELIADWRDTRPAVHVQYEGHGTQAPPRIIADQTVSQAIVNILNNAADASPHEVEIAARWNMRELTLEVCDRGPGLDANVEARAGELFFSTKEPGQGLGLGLFLAQATLSRLGGSVHLYNRPGGGACTRIELPLTQLVITP